MELYLSFGRFAFVFFTVGYFAGKFRTLSFLRKHWRLFHYFNYLGFLVVSYHAFKVGTDFASMPYVFYFWFSLFWVGGIIVWKIFNALRETTS